jgi:hypothetical protein
VLISNEPLAPLTTVLAMALTAGLGAVVAGWGLKHFGQALALPLNHRRHLIRKE